MDGLMLLREARRAGLEVRAEGDRLVIRGPRRLEPLAKRLLAEKPKVLEALQRLCPSCLTEAWVWDAAGRRLCHRCMNLPSEFGQACRPRPIPTEAAREVKRIEDEALARGWTREELWQAAGWVSHLGLAAMLRPGGAVEGVSQEAITVRLRDGKRLRLYRRRWLQ